MIRTVFFAQTNCINELIVSSVFIACQKTNFYILIFQAPLFGFMFYVFTRALFFDFHDFFVFFALCFS